MSEINHESTSVQNYLMILQGVISRMANNSAACKTWCIALISALLVVTAEKQKSEYLLVAAVPVVLFGLLDSYYLGLERRFRDVYNGFIAKLHTDSVGSKDLFVVTLKGTGWDTAKSTLKAVASVSIWPFYGLLLAVLAAIIWGRSLVALWCT